MITSVARHDPARLSLNEVGVHTWTSKLPNRQKVSRDSSVLGDRTPERLVTRTDRMPTGLTYIMVYQM